MNKLFSISLFLTLFLFSSVSAQTRETLSDTDLKVIREMNYKGKALYGFMNGGSDLYLEYGFKELKAIELEYSGHRYSVEIYIMPTPEDAFGIYSQHTFKCFPVESASLCGCSSTSQFQAAEGNIYLSIVFTPGLKDTKDGAFSLARYFLDKFGNGDRLSVPYQIDSIADKKEIPLHLKYVRGIISMGNINYPVLQYLDNLDPYDAWIFKKENNPDLFLITFDTKEHLEIFMQRIETAKEDSSSTAIPDLPEIVSPAKANKYSVLWSFGM
jgi:hypothetical protein